MGLTRDDLFAEYAGTIISVHVGVISVWNGGMWFELCINNRRAERKDTEVSATAGIGKHSLFGELELPDGRVLPVVANMKAGFFGTKYKLKVNGEEIVLTRGEESEIREMAHAAAVELKSQSRRMASSARAAHQSPYGERVVERSERQVVQREVLVTRCKFCREITPVDLDTCKNCGAAKFC